MGKNDSKKAPTIEEYQIEVEKFKEISKELGRPLKYEELGIHKLRSSRWYILHCKNNKVTNYNTFIEYEIGLTPRFMLSKEKIIEAIMEIQSKLNRPIKKSDVEKSNTMSIGLIQRIWGNFNNMKESLGLTINQPNMNAKQKSIFEVKRDIVILCAYVLNNHNRINLTVTDWKLVNNIPSYPSCAQQLFEEGTTIRQFIESIGFNLIESGSGINYLYDSEELVKSQFEYIFSNYLISIGLIYNKDYFRNIRYASFIKVVCGYDCDYVVNYNNRNKVN